MFSPASPSSLPGGRLENNSYVTAREYDKYTPAVGQESFKENKKMQTKLISQTGLKVRTNCRLGFYTFHNGSLTQAQSGNNKCIKERDSRTIRCELTGWPKDVWNCAGNNNGKKLDACMADVWGPEELKTYRSQGGTPYNSPLGDKCFNEFYGRHQQGVALNQNWNEWGDCLATVP
jgi:hypothetical protein